MGTIIETGRGRFIASDPPSKLAEGEHWCDYCGGDGLEEDEQGLAICRNCSGNGVLDYTDTACRDHSTLHPFERVVA